MATSDVAASPTTSTALNASATLDAAPDDAPALPPPVRIGYEHQEAIDRLVGTAIDEGKLPGCVVSIGRSDGVLFERAYGDRQRIGAQERMSVDTIFDLASLTKSAATTLAVMQLAERGALDLDAPIADVLPAFAEHGKARISPRDLLLHRSGLRSVNPLSDYEGGRQASIERILRSPVLKAQRGAFHYSDLGFIVLGELVSTVAKEPLDAYLAREIFAPLEMHDTNFRPSAALRSRIAPTTERQGEMIRGEVQDPRAHRLDGVAGHAGLFSTVNDLSRLARALLRGGELDGRRILDEASVRAMTQVSELPDGGRRALGWDASSLAAQGLSARAYGHGGYTGTWLWIDPGRDLYIVFLSHRVHIDPKPRIRPLTFAIAHQAVLALEDVAPVVDEAVLLGIDVLRREDYRRLRNKRVALLTNRAGRARDGTATVDLLIDAEHVDLRLLFTPEHGLGGNQEGKVADTDYRGVPVHSLFGSTRAPSAEQLQSIDAIVVDLQDVGVRFYTYASTLSRVMHAASNTKVELYLLDRPNPLGGGIEGTISSSRYASFVNHHPLPLRHGLTIAELARLIAIEDELSLDLEVVPMQGWARRMRWEQTGLRWMAPSPNLGRAEQALVYSAVGLLEGTNLSVGRGTAYAFEVIGAPWIDPSRWLAALRTRDLPGVVFDTTHFIAARGPYRKKLCHGVRLRVVDADRFRSLETGLALAATLERLHGSRFALDEAAPMIADDELLGALHGDGYRALVDDRIREAHSTFEARAASVRLYP